VSNRITFARLKKQRFDVGPSDIAVNRAGKRIARLSYDSHGGRGWYWYGDGVNTVGAVPFADLDEAKAHVLAHFKAKAGGEGA